MKETLRIVNEMQAASVIEKYAIGGAVAATFYLEPRATYDLDIFVSFKAKPGQLIVSPAPIYDYLRARGYKEEQEHIVIEGWPVQFLPADDALYGEALAGAKEVNVGPVKTRVMTPEHLMAIALKTGRSQDTNRIREFVKSKVYQKNKLHDIFSRNGLIEKWNQFQKRNPGDFNE